MIKLIANLGWSLCLTLAVVAAAPASAHHSGAGYDMTKTYTAAQATLKEFRWGAPHSAAVFEIKDKDGKPQELTLATTSPGMLTRQGFKPKDFKAGDKVDITWHPSKNGNLAGTLSSIKLPDGRILKDAEFEGARNGDNEAKQVE
jgi:hypothetical protein